MAKKYKYKYELMSGGHAQSGKINLDTGKKVGTKFFSKGDVFETDTDLIKLFGVSAQAKFRLVATNDPTLQEQISAPVDDTLSEEEVEDEVEEEVDTSAEDPGPVIGSLDDEYVEEDDADDDGLDNMSLAELRKLASKEGIDLGNARKKKDVVNAIRDFFFDEE